MGEVMSSAQKTDVYPFVQQDPMEYSAEFARRRVEEPVSRVELASGETAWLLTRYADIRAVLSDDRFQPWVPGMSADDGYGMIFTMSGPGHARLRRLAARALTPRRVGLLEPRIRRHADDLVAKLVAKGPGADLLENLALPLAMSALGELLGVPAGEWDRLRNWAGGLSEVISASTATEMAELGAKLGGYVVSLIEAKRAEPGEDLLSELIAVEDQGDRLEDGELTSLVFAFFLAGYLPPANALASGVLQLLREGRLRASEAVPDVVEELLAADQSSATDQPRVATEDVEVGGALIRAGEFVLAPLRAANQDPARGEGPHLTFGHGPHRCLGAALARMELTSGLGALLAGPGEFSLAVPWADLGWRPLFLTLQGPTAVPLTW
jgi:cytochrome P450